MVLYLISFVLFIFHQSGSVFAFGFGFRGISFFIMSSPWLLIGTSFIFLILLYLLVTQYSFSFKQPLLYTMLSLILLSLLGSWLIQQTTVHQRIGHFTERHDVPVFSPLYRNAMNQRPDGLVVGQITEISGSDLVLTSEQGESITIKITEKTRMPRETPIIVGEYLIVFGERDESVITAFGIKPRPDNFMSPPLKISDHKNPRASSTEYRTPQLPPKPIPNKQ